jgi:hypothetical protein
MARENSLKVVTLVAGEDLSTFQFAFVKVGTASNEVVSCGAGELGIGVLLNKPLTGQACEVALIGGGGIYKVKAAGALATPGTRLSSDADGKAEAAGAGDYVMGVQLSIAGAEDELVEVLAQTSVLVA